MKALTGLFVLGVLCLGTPLGLAADEAEDTAAIETTVRNYLEGWFTSDQTRMEKALHPNLLKATVRNLTGTEAEYLDIMEAEALVAYTGHNQKWVEGKGVEELQIIYQDDRFAVVHAVSTDFMDICGLVKLNGEWRILQVLWTQR